MCNLKSILTSKAAVTVLALVLMVGMTFSSCATSQTIRVNQDDGEKKQSTEIETKGSIQSFAIVINPLNNQDYGKISQASITPWTSSVPSAR